jgi:anti-sigma-K factor RskA
MSVVRHGAVTLPEDVARCEANHANNKQLWARKQRKRVWSVARAAVRVLALIKHQFQALTYRVNV